MAIVTEDDVRPLELAPPLYVDLLGPVHEDVGDGPILHQRLEGTETERLVLDLDDELLALGAAEGRVVSRDHVLDDAANLLLDRVERQDVQLGQVQTFDELSMDAGLQLVVRLPATARGLGLIMPVVRRDYGADNVRGSGRGLPLEQCHLSVSRDALGVPYEAHERGRAHRARSRRGAGAVEAAGKLAEVPGNLRAR